MQPGGHRPRSMRSKPGGCMESEAAVGAHRPPALLLIDGTHLSAALTHHFPGLTDDERRTLVEGLVTTLEDAFGVSFKQRVLHEATPTGQPSGLALSLSSCPRPISPRTRAMAVSTGRPIDPNTLEPRQHESETSLLVDSGVDVAMSMELIRCMSMPLPVAPGSVPVPVPSPSCNPRPYSHQYHTISDKEDMSSASAFTVTGTNTKTKVKATHASASSSASSRIEAAVVITARSELAEAFQMVQSQVWVCGLSKSLGPELCGYTKDGASLDDMLQAAAERLWTKGLNRRCVSWRRCPSVSDDAHTRRHTHACPDWSGCCYAACKPGQDPYPFTRSKVDHMSRFLHPCARDGSCKHAGPYHQMAWVHESAWAAPSPSRPSQHSHQRYQLQRSTSTSGLGTSGKHTTSPAPAHGGGHGHGLDGDKPDLDLSLRRLRCPCEVDGRLEEDWLNIVRFALRGADGAGESDESDDEYGYGHARRRNTHDQQDEDEDVLEVEEPVMASGHERDGAIFSMSL